MEGSHESFERIHGAVRLHHNVVFATTKLFYDRKQTFSDILLTSTQRQWTHHGSGVPSTNTPSNPTVSSLVCRSTPATMATTVRCWLQLPMVKPDQSKSSHDTFSSLSLPPSYPFTAMFVEHRGHKAAAAVVGLQFTHESLSKHFISITSAVSPLILFSRFESLKLEMCWFTVHRQWTLQEDLRIGRARLLSARQQRLCTRLRAHRAHWKVLRADRRHHHGLAGAGPHLPPGRSDGLPRSLFRPR